VRVDPAGWAPAGTALAAALGIGYIAAAAPAALGAAPRSPAAG